MLQYIGARYVPIFYQNSLDPTSSEWESNVTYEPMTWVELSNGHMYISKKEVPANIGTPASNPEYWLEAGQYNAYIQNLQDQIDDMNDSNVSGSLQNQIDGIDSDVDALEKVNDTKKILFIGDSYNTVVPGSGWDETFISLAGLSPSDYTKISIAGTGFTTSPSWYDTVNNRLSLISDKDLYSDVIVCGGANDVNATYSTLLSAMTSFKTLIETNFPNAKIRVGFIGCHGLAQYHATFNSARINYKTACEYLGIEYLHNVEYVLFWKPYLNDNTINNPYDYIHPTADGLRALGEKIFQAYRTGCADVRYSAAVNLTVSGVGASIATDGIIATLINGNGYLYVQGTSLSISEATAASAGKTVATFTSDLFNPQALYITVPYRLPSSDGSASSTVMAFTNGSLAVAPNNPVPANTSMRTSFQYYGVPSSLF